MKLGWNEWCHGVNKEAGEAQDERKVKGKAANEPALLLLFYKVVFT